MILRRRGETVLADVTEDTILRELEVRTGDELLVPQRGWSSRNIGTLVTAAAGLFGVLVALIVR